MSKSNALRTFRKLTLCAALAALAANAVPASAALMPSSPGALDPTLNSGASVVRPFDTGSNYSVAVTALDGGKTLIAGYGGSATSKYYVTYLTRLLPDGTPDPAFGSNGKIHFGDAEKEISGYAGVLGADDKYWIVGSTSLLEPHTFREGGWIARVNADGTADASFGAHGQRVVNCAPIEFCHYTAVTAMADGRVMMTAVGSDGVTSKTNAFVDRYLPDGNVDLSFGTNGRVVLPAAFDKFRPWRIQVDAAGRIVMAGSIFIEAADKSGMMVLRLLADGKTDPAFGSGGVVTRVFDNANSYARNIALQADGRMVVAGYSYNGLLKVAYQGWMTRLNADGSTDTGFGDQGRAVAGAQGLGLGTQADGKIVVSGQIYDEPSARYTGMIARFLPNGTPDLAFAKSGVALPYAAEVSSVQVLAIGADNRLVGAGNAFAQHQGYYDSYLFARVIGTETTTSVVEFYNSALNHYFITADPNEASAIDAGAAGPGWSRTGFAWKSGGPARVCRFYGSPEVDPATAKRMGPNGHFYTISADECALVKDDAGWKFESYDFSGWAKQANGQCAQGTIAVKRVYNNRFAVNDSNHRYTTSDAIYNQMLASGWSGEGAVFCAPQ